MQVKQRGSFADQLFFSLQIPLSWKKGRRPREGKHRERLQISQENTCLIFTIQKNDVPFWHFFLRETINKINKIESYRQRLSHELAVRKRHA